ncbi:ABC transporter ATP-binding protein [Corticibacter populi]|nr:ABC transporter ATP-binding protein [Corticibacter populi]RZS33347.1 ABC-2 type transport system ATP-binding protein [Corticibacter populi]
MTDTLIEFVRVNKSFKLKGRRQPAVQDLSFSVRAGEAIGFVGPNGAGKSTSMKMLMGMLRPDKGEALLMGWPAADERARQGVGYVPENPYLYDYLTPLEIVTMGLQIHGRARGREAAQRAMQWLERMGIGYAAHKRVRNLSKGMTQRTALAHALALEPRLLVLDEPMSGLDPVGRKLVADEVQLYREGGGTLFFCSHILNDVERLASRVLLIDKGQLKADQPLQGLLNKGGLVLRYHLVGQPLPGFASDGTDIWRAQIPAGQLWQTLHAIEASNGTLIDVHQGLSLEQMFVDLVAASA